MRTRLTDAHQLPQRPGPDHPLFYRLVAMTGRFETGRGIPGCFSRVSGNFDGQGVSLGLLQQNFGQGSLQPLLTAMERDHPAVMATVFAPEHRTQFQAMLTADRSTQTRWAAEITDDEYEWPRWRAEFAALGRTREYQSLQLQAAHRVYQRSLDLAKQFGLRSERGVALMFDLVTQNGGMRGARGDATPAIHRDFAALRDNGQDNEANRLTVIAERRAAVANPRWQADVRNRKLSIARGTGTIHGRTYHLERDFGITTADALDLQPLATAIQNQRASLRRALGQEHELER